MSKPTRTKRARRLRNANAPRRPNTEGLTGRALARAYAIQASGRLSRADRMAFAWGWAEGFRAARSNREQPR